jgi:outer membrane protein TolC
MTQNVLDLSSIRRYQSSKIGIRVARSSVAETQDQTASRIARYYVAALRADANLEVAVENVKLAEAILRQAEALQAAGTGTGIEVTRSRVLLANEKQKQLVAENGVSRARQELLRAMNIRLDTILELIDRLAYSPLLDEALPAWKERAMKNRNDLKAQEEKEAQSKLAISAQRMERAPSVSAFGDYGTLGSGISNSIPTRTYGLSIKVPIFDGGRREGKVSEFASLHRQEQIRTNHLRDQMELELRLALDAIRSANREVEVAIEGLTQSEKELAQARRRYEVGVANSMEVSDAQTRLAQARDNRVAALYRHNVARIDLADAAGTVQAFVQGENQ